MGEAVFSKLLLEWWDQHGRKNLPWQHPRSPYRVWVSEIMLQQTQVKTVIPYFNRFMDRLPDVASLAEASTDEILSLWSGLGYYARARNLQKAARLCIENHAGELPVTPEELLALPGIGESTANAIYSQAWDQPAVILDGNVKRVLSRYFAIDGWPGKADVHKKLWNIAADLLPKIRGADYSQATMDLGATLCTRSKPACIACPVQESCKARQQESVHLFPAKRPRLKVTKKAFQMVILINDNNEVLLERRPPSGIWGGLWSLPADDDGRSLQHKLGVETGDLNALPAMKHQLTHIEMRIEPRIGHSEALARGVECTSDQGWFGRDEWPTMGLPKPVRQLLETYWRMVEDG